LKPARPADYASWSRAEQDAFYAKIEPSPEALAAEVSLPVVSGAVQERTYQLKWHGAADDTPLKEWLVDKMLPKVGKGLIAGQWGTYKTFVALDLAGSVMTKTPFAGRPVKRQGGVLFIAAEGQDEIRVRLEGIAREKVASLRAREGIATVDPGHMPFVWIESCPRLTSDNASQELRAIAEAAQKEMLARFNLPLALIAIDTLMPAAGFKDANDASEAQRVMTVLTELAQATEALVLPVDHFGKNIDTGTRNSSVKEDAVDAVLALLADRDLAGAVSNSRLAIRKVRGAPTGEQIPFVTRSVVVYENAGFDAITTLVIDWRPTKPTEEKSTPVEKTKRWPKSLLVFRRALENTIAAVGQPIRPFPEGPEVLATRRDAVRAEFLKIYPADDPKAKGQAFRRCEKDAVAEGLMTARDLGPAEKAETYFWTVSK
jgi:AAA domain